MSANLEKRVMLAIDPGLDDKCGAAVFSNGKLVFATRSRLRASKRNQLTRALLTAEHIVNLVRTSDAMLKEPTPDYVIVEWPQAYQPGRGGGNNNDLFPLTAIAGAIAAEMTAWNPVVELATVLPAAWKGQLKDHIVQGRVLARLDDAEKVVLTNALKGLAESSHNHVTDAVGIGLDALGRFQQNVLGDSR